MRAILAGATLLVAVLSACAEEAREGPGVFGIRPVAAAAEDLAGTIWEVDGARRIDRATLVAALDGADVAILGEIHDNPLHHDRQAGLVAAIAPAAIAFEMVPAASEEGIQVFLAEGGAPEEIGPAIGWERLGWPDWEMYRPVFEAAFAANAEVYLAGGGVAGPDLMAAMREGAAAGFGARAGEYGLEEPLAPALQAEAEAEMVASHCDALPPEMAPGMVEAQRLRDAAFADAVRRARAMGGGQAVLITGNGHARKDRGVPAALAAAEPGLAVMSLGQLEVEPGTALADLDGSLPYDFVWFSEPAERGDPCAAFR